MERPTPLILATNHRLNVVPYIFLFLKCLIITTQRVRFKSSGFWFILTKKKSPDTLQDSYIKLFTGFFSL